MKKTLLPALVTALLGFFTPWVQAAVPSPSKSQSLEFLSGLKDQNVSRLKEIDAALTQKIARLNSPKGQPALESDIDHLRHLKKEHMLRQLFLNRLSLQVDSKYNGQDMKQFLSAALANMADIDVKSSDSQSMWKFLNDLKIVINQLPSQSNNILSFVEGYMKSSPIENPMSPDDFYASMNYYNGSESAKAHGVSRGKVGEIADHRLSELKAEGLLPSTTATPAIPEQR